jgi:hypothetical protein
MNRPLFLLVFAALVVCDLTTFGGEPLKDLPQGRTLDIQPSNESTLAGAFSELNERYRAKYGEGLPMFISLELLAPKAKPANVAPAQTPGLPVPGAPGGKAVPLPNGPITRIGGRLYNVPMLDVVKYYTNMFDVAYTVGPDVILIQKVK